MKNWKEWLSINEGKRMTKEEKTQYGNKAKKLIEKMLSQGSEYMQDADDTKEYWIDTAKEELGKEAVEEIKSNLKKITNALADKLNNIFSLRIDHGDTKDLDNGKDFFNHIFRSILEKYNSNKTYQTISENIVQGYIDIGENSFTICKWCEQGWTDSFYFISFSDIVSFVISISTYEKLKSLNVEIINDFVECGLVSNEDIQKLRGKINAHAFNI